jgi:hypothetical protein
MIEINLSALDGTAAIPLLLGGIEVHLVSISASSRSAS